MFKNGGREWRPKGQSEEVRVHDFKIKELGRVAPYGVYDIGANVGWAGVGTARDKVEFAVATIRNWWRRMGSSIYISEGKKGDGRGTRRDQYPASRVPR